MKIISMCGSIWFFKKNQTIRRKEISVMAVRSTTYTTNNSIWITKHKKHLASHSCNLTLAGCLPKHTAVEINLLQ